MMFNDELGDIREVFINVAINTAKSEVRTEDSILVTQENATSSLKKNTSLWGIQMEISWISA